MHARIALAADLLFLAVALTAPATSSGQALAAPFARWSGELQADARLRSGSLRSRVTGASPAEQATTRSHTLTGLLIGGLVGAAATTVFLIGFCGDPDTACQGDEVGRAILIIGVPCAAAGALIGTLIRTEEAPPRAARGVP
jgi:hypothetical protein